MEFELKLVELIRTHVCVYNLYGGVNEKRKIETYGMLLALKDIHVSDRFYTLSVNGNILEFGYFEPDGKYITL